MADIEEFRRLLQEQQQRALAEADQDAAKAGLPAAGAASSAIVDATTLDAATRALLETIVKNRDDKQIGYSNADLAEELLKSEKVKEGASALSSAQRAIVQRLALVSRMFAAVTEDATIPEGFKGGFASLRFPLIKSALADPGFFSQRAHPLRIVAGDLVQKASESRLLDKQGERHLEELLQNASRDFDLSASFVRPALVKLTPLDAPAIEQFVAQQGEEKKDRDAMRNRRARDVVGKAIQSRVLTTRLPQLVEFLIHEEWAAVLVKRLLEKGPEGASWREGLQLLDELLEHVPAAEEGRPIPDPLLKRLESGLKEAGVEDSGGLTVLRGLRKLTAWMEERQPGGPEAGSAEMPRLVPADAPEGDPIDSTLDEILAKQVFARQAAPEPQRPPSRPPPRAEPSPPRVEPPPAPPPRAAPPPPPPPRAAPPPAQKVIETRIETPRAEPRRPEPPRMTPPTIPPSVPPHLRAEPRVPQTPPPLRADPPQAPPAPSRPQAAPQSPAWSAEPPRRVDPPRAAPPPPPPPPPRPTPPPPPVPPPAAPPPTAQAPSATADAGARPRDTAAVAAVQAAARAPFLQTLGDLLRAGRWFRVYEHSTQKMRWVKLEAFYPAQNSIVFAEFDGASPLGVNADQFVKDLKQGLSSPTNPDAQTRALLAQLIKFDAG